MFPEASRERGTSLLEVMVALVILSTVIMALTGMMWQMSRHAGLSETGAYRTAALERSVALAEGVAWDSMSNVVGCTTDTSGTLAYTRCLQLTTPTPNLHHLTVIVVPGGLLPLPPETVTVYRPRPRQLSTLYQ